MGQKYTLLRLSRLQAASVLVLLLVLAVVVAYLPSLADGAKDKPLRYKAFATASAAKSVCYGARGLYVGLDVRELKRVPLKDLEALARKNKPRAVTVSFGGKRKTLTIDSKTSGAGLRAVWWNFKPVRLSSEEVQSLVKKPVLVAWRVGGKQFTQQAVVQASPCN